MNSLRGLCAFPITPADMSGRVDTKTLGRLLERLVAAQVDSIGLLGSTGTYAYLERAERRRAIEAAADIVGARMPLLVGIGALRTDEAVALALDAKAAGASAGLLAPVSYLPLNDDEVFAHFTTVAGTSDLPIYIYNNPSTTHFSFTPDLIARLSEVPGIVGVKNPAPPAAEVKALHEDLRRRVGAAFSLGYSVDWHAGAALLAGGQVWYSVLGGTFPRTAARLAAAALAGDADGVRAIDAKLAPLWELFRTHGSLRVIYAALNLTGLATAQAPLPIQPLAGPARERLAALLGELDLD